MPEIPDILLQLTSPAAIKNKIKKFPKCCLRFVKSVEKQLSQLVPECFVLKIPRKSGQYLIVTNFAAFHEYSFLLQSQAVHWCVRQVIRRKIHSSTAGSEIGPRITEISITDLRFNSFRE